MTPAANIHFSSVRGDWPTPPGLFATLNAEFSFTLDAAASPINAKAARYFTEEDDGLAQPWDGTVFVNPPYGRGIGKWIEKTIREADAGATVVMLVPARTDTRWFQALLRRAEIRFLEGRITFEGATQPAPFPSAIAVLRPPARWSSKSGVAFTLPTRHAAGTNWTTVRVVGDA